MKSDIIENGLHFGVAKNVCHVALSVKTRIGAGLSLLNAINVKVISSLERVAIARALTDPFQRMAKIVVRQTVNPALQKMTAHNARMASKKNMENVLGAQNMLQTVNPALNLVAAQNARMASSQTKMAHVFSAHK